jgi:ubiquinone/menaquinone biosynthesis C-methylase UbiE
VSEVQEIGSLSPRVKEYFAMDNAAVSWWETKGHPRYAEQERLTRTLISVENKRVLDVATGRGRFAIGYAQAGARDVLAVDISRGMLAVSRENAQRAGVDHGIQFIQGDVETMTLGSDSFDVVNCMEVYVHFPNPTLVTRRLYEALRPGGRLVANIDLPITGRWYFHWFNEPLSMIKGQTSRFVSACKRNLYPRLPLGLRRVAARWFDWPVTPQAAQNWRLDGTEATIQALQQDPTLKLSRAEDAIHRIELRDFVSMLENAGFAIAEVVREGRWFQLAYGYVVVAVKPG